MKLKMHRRQFLQTAARASGGISLAASGQVTPPKEGTVRDKLWLFSNPTNGDYAVIRKRSVMSPFEAAVYMGIPNILMVNEYEKYRPGEEGYVEPWLPPLLHQYAMPLSLLKRVVWSIVGAGGVTKPEEREAVLALARRTPNIVGLFMDDFFHDRPGRELASLSLDQLGEIQGQIKGSGKKMDLFVTLYNQGLNSPIAEYLKLIDVITYWIRRPEDLADQDACLTKLEKLAPHCRIMLGVDTFAQNRGQTPAWTDRPIPLQEKLCEEALGWLRSGRIEGIIIYGGTTLDVGYQAAEWTRQWIKKIGDTKI
jgi:hypothetical protein